MRCHHGTVAPPTSPLLELARQHHPLQLLSAGVVALHTGFIDTQGTLNEPLPTHIAEHAHLELLEHHAPWYRKPDDDDPLDVAEWATAATSAILIAQGGEGTRLVLERHGSLFDSPHRRLAAQQHYWYDPVLAEAEIERLDDLLAPFAEEIEAAAGAGLADLTSIFHSCAAIAPQWLAGVVDLREPVETAAELMTALRQRVAEGGTTIVPGGFRPAAIGIEQLVRDADVDRSAVDAFLKIFGHTLSDEPATGASYLERLWRLRRRPILTVGGGVAVPVGYNLIPAFRAGLERLLAKTDQPAWQRYDAAKGKWLERRALALLADALTPDHRYRSLRVPARAGTPPERDGLVIVDTVALAVEIKGGGMPPSARLGSQDAQEKVIQRLVIDSAAQAQSLAAALEAGEPVTGVDERNRRVGVTLGDVAHLLPVVITLEDVSGITSRSQLVGDPEQRSPWVVALDELQWYVEALALPAQVLHYALVRARLVHETVAVLDEGDWFRLYRALGAAGCLAFVDGVADLAEQVVMYGGNDRRGRVPAHVAVWQSPLHELLERFNRERNVGWLEASFALLDLSDGQAGALEDAIADARSQAVDDTFPMATFRPFAAPETALHVLVPAPARDHVRAESLLEWAGEHAPDAARHIFLVSLAEGVNGLVVGPIALAGQNDPESAPT